MCILLYSAPIENQSQFLGKVNKVGRKAIERAWKKVRMRSNKYQKKERKKERKEVKKQRGKRKTKDTGIF